MPLLTSSHRIKYWSTCWTALIWSLLFLNRKFMMRTLNQDPVEDQFPPQSEEVIRSLLSLAFLHICLNSYLRISPNIYLYFFCLCMWVSLNHRVPLLIWKIPHGGVNIQSCRIQSMVTSKLTRHPDIQLHRDLDIFLFQSRNCKGTQSEGGQHCYCSLFSSRAHLWLWT